MIAADSRHLLASALFVFSALLLPPGATRAGVIASASPTFPTSVTVGQTAVSASIQIGNVNTPPNTGETNTVCNFGDALPCPSGDPGIILIPSCGQVGAFSSCTAADPGVFQLPATAQGQAGSACEGMTFNVAMIDPAFGTLRFTPQGGVHVMLPAVGSVCRIGFTFDVLKSPFIDSSPITPGTQTTSIVANTQHSGGVAASARGAGSGTTVLLATPTIATTASPDIVLGAGQLTDTATVSARANPQPGASIDFRLYAPGDTTCINAPIFQSLNVPYPVGSGPVTSAPFTPSMAGTYRWRAFYSGDVNNLPVSGACNDSNENVVVSLPALIFADGFEG